MHSSKRHTRTLGAALLLFLAGAGCDLGQSPLNEILLGPQLDAIVDGKQVSFPANQPFSVELDLNADAGYSWDITFTDPTVVRLEKASYRPKSGNWNQCGGMTVATYYFRTLKSGQCSIIMKERQRWLPDVPPIHSVWFTVVVNR